MATKTISVVYPVVGGAAAAATARLLLGAGRRFLVGTNKTPSGRGGGRTALLWTALSWAVPVGIGLYTGKKLIRRPAALQPAQS